MKNVDDPDLADSDGLEPARGPRVELFGGPLVAAKRFQEKLAASVTGDAARIAELFGAAGVHAPLTEALTANFGESLRETLAADSAARKDAIMASLRAVDVPRIDLSDHIANPRVKPLELPKPVRPIMDVRLEQLVDAVLALDEAMEARHVETESRADARAQRADARADRAELLARWGVTFAGLAAAGVVWEIVIR